MALRRPAPTRSAPASSDRRQLMIGMGAGALAAATGALAAPAAADDLTWMPAWRIRELIGRKVLSPVEVTDHFLARIQRLDPTLKAFRHLDAEGARAQARRAEQAVMQGAPLGPLHGVPTSVKEQLAVAGMPVMTFGLGGAPIAERDDILVERLRAAGAVIVGVNSMMGTASASWGQYNWAAEARNPWDLARSPGWSSSGSAIRMPRVRIVQHVRQLGPVFAGQRR